MSDGFGRHHAEIIPEYARAWPNHRVLIETGTHVCQNAARMAPHFDLVITIDLTPDFTIGAIQATDHLPNVIPVHADSEALIPQLVDLFGKPCVFFLDAHWDHDPGERRGNSDTPVRDELEAVLASPLRHVVLIDDARFFLDGAYRDTEYPRLAWVEEKAQAHDYDCAVADDVIRLTPRAGQ